MVDYNEFNGSRRGSRTGESLYREFCLLAKLFPTLLTPRTIACQAPLSTEFSRQEHWSGLPFPYPVEIF